MSFLIVFFTWSIFFFFFFFQAEDGIRDLTVTGVQTCALPISTSRITSAADVIREVATEKGASLTEVALACNLRRSEERRVGKSVDLGGRRIIKKKKKKKSKDNEDTKKTRKYDWISEQVVDVVV